MNAYLLAGADHSTQPFTVGVNWFAAIETSEDASRTSVFRSRARHRAPREDHELGIVVTSCPTGEEGVPIAKALCRELMIAAESHHISTYDYDDLVQALLKVQSLATLDELFSGDLKWQRTSVRLLNDLAHFHKNVLNVLPDETAITWCDRDPTMRYPLAASVVLLFNRPKKGEPHEWAPLAKRLLGKAPEPLLVLNEIVHRLYPLRWSGSLASKLEGRLKLLNSLAEADAPALAEPLAEARKRFQAKIDAERRSEQEADRARNNRFE
ncbi:hypothetical protein [Mesorhizobium sp.]|uniref:hypothetical protein n=1 Tax=Mesorhizobium sp. TaxID=1871066 RepID=UPI000FE622DA|nr:hypothetical protein [Mesorhizobium sp.]RWI29567.1 MAG: hypothetical protein EOQ92_04290 [Mesorhizobium sp.]RWK52531.1 MAG: hypothetical protein EOR47_03880 [Mesorhizobium sp.]RWK97589.1 MAG: hypothetical protein EOR53_05700 [Mesorhizobium sp.]TIP57034.1 MAG: hypothetical protein E5X56_21885 [Mesorhizobium sp.]TIQ00271.1 MAG: hypothetical protein E5X60_05565 [Mesorhizobium sp.]